MIASVNFILAALGVVVAALFVFACLAGSMIYSAIGAAHALETGEDETAELTGRRYSRRRRQKARSRGTVAARQGLGASMCPYRAKDDALKQEWMSAWLIERMKRLPQPDLPLRSEFGILRSERPPATTRRAAP